MRALRTAAATIVLLLAVGVTCSAVECSFNPQSFPSAASVFHRLSATAELVAAPARRRAVNQPPSPPDLTAKNFVDDEVFGKMVQDNVPWTEFEVRSTAL